MVIYGHYAVSLEDDLCIAISYSLTRYLVEIYLYSSSLKAIKETKIPRMKYIWGGIVARKQGLYEKEWKSVPVLASR